jgi:dihydrofolate reductase
MTELALIAALDRRGAIGRGNALPWHLPDDLKRFKALTLDAPVLMGRRTAESLGRALPRRRNIVLSRRRNAPFPGMHGVDSLEQALALAEGAPRLWVIGGGEIYRLCLPHAKALYLTQVDTEVEGGDAFFPTLQAAHWREVARQAHPLDAHHPLAFEFVDYRRVATA